MAYDEIAAEKLRKALRGRRGVTEKKMFGGIAFMLRGNMCCGVVGKDLMFRVGPDGYDKALAAPHARPMDFTGTPLKGFIYVGPKGYATEAGLKKWVAQAAEFAMSLPAK